MSLNDDSRNVADGMSPIEGLNSRRLSSLNPLAFRHRSRDCDGIPLAETSCLELPFRRRMGLFRRAAGTLRLR